MKTNVLFFAVFLILLSLTKCSSQKKPVDKEGLLPLPSDEYYQGIIFLASRKDYKTGIIKVFDSSDPKEIMDSHVAGIIYFFDGTKFTERDTVYFKINKLKKNKNYIYIATDLTTEAPSNIKDIKNYKKTHEFPHLDLHRLSDHNDQNHKAGHIRPIYGQEKSGRGNLIDVTHSVGITEYKLMVLEFNNSPAIDTFWYNGEVIDENLDYYYYKEDIKDTIRNNTIGVFPIIEVRVHSH